jgi:hypothetical protein
LVLILDAPTTLAIAFTLATALSLFGIEGAAACWDWRWEVANASTPPTIAAVFLLAEGTLATALTWALIEAEVFWGGDRLNAPTADAIFLLAEEAVVSLGCCCARLKAWTAETVVLSDFFTFARTAFTFILTTDRASACVVGLLARALAGRADM